MSSILPRFFILLLRRPPILKRTVTFFSYTTLFRSIDYCWLSCIAAPSGEVLASAQAGEELLLAELYLDRLRLARSEFPFLKDRRACDGAGQRGDGLRRIRSEEDTSELQAQMRILYDVCCLRKTI